MPKEPKISYVVENAEGSLTKKSWFSRKPKKAPGKIVQGISGQFQKYATTGK